MDYVTRQFINLTKKFRKESRELLELLHNDIQEHTKAIRAQTKSGSQVQQQLPIPVQIKFEPNEITQQQPPDERQHRIQNSIRKATWCAFLAATFYGAIAALQWRDFNESMGISQIIARQSRIQTAAAKKAADAAASAAGTAGTTLATNQGQFRMQERPYLFPDPRGEWVSPALPGQTLFLEKASDAPVNSFGVVIDLRNGGRSPAVEVTISRTEYKIGLPDEVRREVMEYVPQYPKETTIITTNSYVSPGQEAVTITKQEVDEWKIGAREIYVVGGVVYRDMFNPRIKPYKSTYCYKMLPVGMHFGMCEFPAPNFRNALE